MCILNVLFALFCLFLTAIVLTILFVKVLDVISGIFAFVCERHECKKLEAN